MAFVARGEARNASATQQLAAAGHDVLAVAGDLTVDTDLERAVQTTVQALGGIDVLVNNAGTCVHAPSWDVRDEEWDAVFDLNVRALWRCSRAVGRHMAAAGGGAVVNVGSMSGIIVNRPQWQPAYNASKAAVHHLTKSLAAEWAPQGIRVNAVAPGYVKTDMAPVDRPELQRYWVSRTRRSSATPALRRSPPAWCSWPVTPRPS